MGGRRDPIKVGDNLSSQLADAMSTFERQSG